MSRPTVAVVIPAKNEESTIEACVRSLKQQTYGELQIIVVDDGSTDRTLEVLERFSDITVLRSDGRGPSRARNLGLGSAAADIIAFTDADCICEPRWVEELVATLQCGPYAGAGGDQHSPPGESPFGRRVQQFLKAVGFVGGYVRTTDHEVPTRHNPTCNVAYQSEVLERVGGFDEALWPGEDVDLDRRITAQGYELAYTPRAVVYHFRPRDMAGFCRMMKNYGRAQSCLMRKHGPFRAIHLVPLVSLAGLSASPLLLCPPLLPASLSLAVAAPWTFFRLRGFSSLQALRNLRLFYATLLWWNVGFAEEMLFRRMA